MNGYLDWYKELKKGQDRAKIHYVDHDVDTGSEGDKSSAGERGQDIVIIIQQELSKCLGNLMGKGNGTGNQMNDVNMIKVEEDKNAEFDGHFAFSVVPSMDEVSWIIDSRASAHVCSNKNMMSSFSKLSKPVKVHLPDGSTKVVYYSGTTKVNEEIMLYNVLFLEGFTYNLLSVAHN